MVDFEFGYKGFPREITKENASEVMEALKSQLPKDVYDAFDRVFLGIKHGLPCKNYTRDYALIASHNDRTCYHVMTLLCNLYDSNNSFLDSIRQAKEPHKEES